MKAVFHLPAIAKTSVIVLCVGVVVELLSLPEPYGSSIGLLAGFSAAICCMLRWDLFSFR